MSRTPGDDAAPSSLEAALIERDERFKFLAENIPVQIWTALPNGGLDYVTEQTASHFGLTAADLLRDGWQNVVHPEDIGLAVERWTHALGTGEPYQVEFRLKLSSGIYAWHLARAVAQRGSDGAILRWFGTNTNIDEEREERRRVQALLDEVAQQAQESATALSALRQVNAVATARIEELEAQLGTP